MNTGTNKERLEQNNAKIDSLIALVKTKGYQTVEVMPSELVLGEWNGVLSAERTTANVILTLNEDDTVNLTVKEEDITMMSHNGTFTINNLTISCSFIIEDNETIFTFTYKPETNTLLADEMLLNISLNRSATESLPSWYLKGTWYPAEEILFLGDPTVSFIFESGNSFKWVILTDDDGLGHPVDPYETTLTGSYNIVGNEILINLDTFSELGTINMFRLDTETGLLYFVSNDNPILVTKTKAVSSKLSQVIDGSITELTAEDFGDMTEIGDYAFYYKTKLTSVEIPNTITKIGRYSFYRCELLNNIILSDEIKEIPEFCFGYAGLKNINLHNKITTLGINAFAWGNLESITIPSSVTTIKPLSFANNSSLKSVIYEGQAPNIEASTFLSCNSVTLYDFSNCTSVPTLANVNALGHASGCIIRVPTSLYDEWTTATNWNALTNVVWEKVGGAELISFTIDDQDDHIVGVTSTVYQAEKGMTWEEWVNSEYNTSGYSLNVEGAVGYIAILLTEGSQAGLPCGVLNNEFSSFPITDEIIDGHIYKTTMLI